MSFIKASQCASKCTTTAMFPGVEMIVSLTVSKNERPEIRIGLLPAAAGKAMLRPGDGIDVGIDPQSNSIQLSLVAPQSRIPCHLCEQKNRKGPNQRLRMGLTVREEWGMRIGHDGIPSMPCTHIVIDRACITARLPDSWKRFWKS